MIFDIIVKDFFASFQNPISTVVFTAISISIYILVAIAAGWLIYKKDKQNFLKLIIGCLFLYVILELLKFVIARPRPNLLTNDSFPSRHSAIAFFISHFLPIDKKIKFLLYVWAALIALSRLILNLHWFTDVLVGSSIGLAFGWGINKLDITELLQKLKLMKS